MFGDVGRPCWTVVGKYWSKSSFVLSDRGLSVLMKNKGPRGVYRVQSEFGVFDEMWGLRWTRTPECLIEGYRLIGVFRVRP